MRKLFAAASFVGARQKSSGGNVEIAECGGHAVAAQVRGWLSKIAGPLGGRQNKRDAAIIYETVVEKMERFADVSRVLIIGQGIRATHDRSRIERGVSRNVLATMPKCSFFVP